MAKKERQRTNNYLQKTTQKTINLTTQTTLKTGYELVWGKY
jgi:hypothetical protein